MCDINRKTTSRWIIKAVVITLGMLIPVGSTADTLFPATDTPAPTVIDFTNGLQRPSVDSKIRISGIGNNGEGVVYQFLNILSHDLTESDAWLFMEDEDDFLRRDITSHASRISQYILLNGEPRHLSSIRRKQVLKASSRAAARILADTKPGKTLIAIEEKLARYFVIELSKNRFEEGPTLLLPGEATPSERKTEKEYAVSLGTSFYTSTDSLDGSYSLELEGFYRGCRFRTEYDFGHAELAFMLEHNLLNRFFNARAAFSWVKEADNSVSGRFQVSWEF